MSETEDEVVISGERNLLSVSDFSSDMGNLRRAFELFVLGAAWDAARAKEAGLVNEVVSAGELEAKAGG